MAVHAPRTLPAVTVLTGFMYYYWSSTVVLLGVLFGNDFLKPPQTASSPPDSVLESLFRFDGLHYKSICVSGYQYDPSRRSEVAFFPVYPLLARGVMTAANGRPEWVLLFIANLSLVITFIGLYAYTLERYREVDSPTLPRNVLLAFGILPMTFFFRMAYSESVFLAASIGTLLAIQRRLSVFWVALLSGLVTATRPVGIAFLPVFLWYSWQRSPNWRSFLAYSLYLAPLASWGLLAYMAYQYAAFGDALAFAKTQQYWRSHADAPWAEKAWALLVLEPLWNLFSSSSGRFWRVHEWHGNPIFSLIAVNPIYFALTAFLIVFGALKRWLNSYEILLGIGLLLIPYVTRGYDNSMFSTGRFAAAVLPVYLVLGQLLNRAPAGLTSLFAAIGSFMLGAYSALFAAGYALF
jgi:hypothetical protein